MIKTSIDHFVVYISNLYVSEYQYSNPNLLVPWTITKINVQRYRWIGHRLSIELFSYANQSILMMNTNPFLWLSNQKQGNKEKYLFDI